MATCRFIDFVKNDLKTSNVVIKAQELANKGINAERTQIFSYLENNNHIDVRCYSMGLLLIKVNLEPCIFPENITILEKSFMLIDKYPHEKNLILYEIALALEKNLREAPTEKKFLRLAKIAYKIRSLDDELGKDLVGGYANLNEKFIIKYAYEILQNPNENSVKRALEFLKSIYTSSSEMEKSIVLLASSTLVYLENRIEILQNESENINNVECEFNIIDLILKFDLNNQAIVKKIKKVKSKFEVIKTTGSLKSKAEIINEKSDASDAEADSFHRYKLRKIKSGITYKKNKPIFARIRENFQVSVYIADYLGTTVATKVYTKLKPDADFTKVYSECKFYQFLSDRANPSHNAFLKYYGTYSQEDSICLVMEYVENDVMGFLTDFKQQNKKDTEMQILQIFNKLIVSFAEMEELGICHGDIKTHNMLIDNNWNIKIIDYSISVVINDSLTGGTTSGLYPLQGTAGYMAPEIIDGINKGQKKAYFKMSRADVFSLGMSFLQMLTLGNYTGYNTKENNHLLMGEVAKLQYPWAQNMLQAMLNVDPNSRPKFKDLLAYINNVYTRTYIHI